MSPELEDTESTSATRCVKLGSVNKIELSRNSTLVSLKIPTNENRTPGKEDFHGRRNSRLLISFQELV